jgi:putative PIN family toxin of toxin-antitoxin system
MASPRNATLLRPVVDVNIIIRGTLSSTGGSALILEALKRKRCLLIASHQYLSEVYAVLARPRMRRRYGITQRRRKRLIARLSEYAVIVFPRGHLWLCRDPKDDYLVEMALLGRATHLVTEDADLHDEPNIRALLQQFDVRLVHIDSFLLDLARAIES